MRIHEIASEMLRLSELINADPNISWGVVVHIEHAPMLDAYLHLLEEKTRTNADPTLTVFHQPKDAEHPDR